VTALRLPPPVAHTWLPAAGVDLDWIARAACGGHDPELWFPIGTDGVDTRRRLTHTAAVDALAICRKCPVREQCLDWALSQGCDFGIFGGTLPQERRVMSAQGAPVAPAGRRCKRCNVVFTSDHATRIYCGRACSEAAHRQRKREWREEASAR
jgi:WhiB family redox-sensing transcriptional regulator